MSYHKPTPRVHLAFPWNADDWPLSLEQTAELIQKLATAYFEAKASGDSAFVHIDESIYSETRVWR